MTDWFLPTFIYLIFCLSHSWLAKPSVKSRLFDHWEKGRVYYRILYSLISLLLITLWVLFTPSDLRVLYKVPFPYSVLNYLFIGLALFGIIRVLFQYGGLTFIGITQLSRYFRHGQEPAYLDEPTKGSVVTTGFNRYVRHPLYSFTILLLISSPVMSVRSLYFTICLILYFRIGSYFEERKLIDRFGEEYRQYQQNTGRLIPKWRT